MGIMGKILKEGQQEFCVYRSLAKFDYSLFFYIYERKQNKCVLVLYCDIIAIKEDCCWLIFCKNFSTWINLTQHSIKIKIETLFTLKLI